MYLVVTDNSDEFARLKLTLGRGIKQVKDRRELAEMLSDNQSHTYNLVLIGSGVELAIALGISEELRVSFPTVGVILLRNKVDSSLTAQSMSAGVRDVIPLNNPEALVLACKRSEDISRRQLQKVFQKTDTSSLGKIIVFHGPKDGVGATTIATNISADFAHRKHQKVCLLDSAQSRGDVAVRFRVESLKSWLDLSGVQEIDDQALGSVITPTKFGLELLLSPREFLGESRNDITSFNQIIRSLQERYSYVLIDTDSTFDQWNKNILYLAHHIVLVATLDLALLKNIKIRLKEISNIDVPEELISLYLNGGDKKVGIKPEDLPELLGIGVAANIPWDFDIMRYANEGEPIVIAKDRSGVSHALMGATDHILESLELAPPAIAKVKSRSRRSA